METLVIRCKFAKRSPELGSEFRSFHSVLHRLPYVAQGAAQAIEDGAVIAVALSGAEDHSEIPNALALYSVSGGQLLALEIAQFVLVFRKFAKNGEKLFRLQLRKPG